MGPDSDPARRFAGLDSLTGSYRAQGTRSQVEALVSGLRAVLMLNGLHGVPTRSLCGAAPDLGSAFGGLGMDLLRRNVGTDVERLI